MEDNTKKTILISACLLGVNCNYKGSCSYDFSKNNCFWSSINRKYNIIPICPEQLGGLSTPRIPSELQDSAANIESGKGRIVNKKGLDVTKNFVNGANEVLRLSKMYNVHFAVLKSKSPSCGTKTVYDGTFSGVLIDGLGYTAYLLRKSKVTIYDEYEFSEILKCTLSSFKC